MTFENWKQSTHPKVIGAQNLHTVLANVPLDFFLMTSSVSGILGTPGQSNYAAANAYLDSLAKHRLSRSTAATSLVLPMVLGVGVVAENAELEDALKRKGSKIHSSSPSLFICIDDLHGISSVRSGRGASASIL